MERLLILNLAMNSPLAATMSRGKIALAYPSVVGLVLLIAITICSMSATTYGENTIDFSKSTHLKVVYDAGLRPWRVRPDEKNSLNLTDQQVRLIAPGTTPFRFDVQIANFSLLAGNEISKADFISHLQSERGLRSLGCSAGRFGRKVLSIDEIRRSNPLAPGVGRSWREEWH